MRRYTPTQSLRQSWDFIGGLSFPGKMPCPGWNIPATTCNVGSKLHKVAGSTCSDCYARKGFYCMPDVDGAMWRRYGALMRGLDNPEAYVSAWTDVLQDMVNRKGCEFFRWHDSGDLQSIDHLELIVRIALASPNVSFWLPTREYGTVRLWLDLFRVFPDNLTVRLSAPMVDGKAPDCKGEPTSEVHTPSKGPRIDGTSCGAYQNDGYCGDCRRCWDASEYVISYPQH